MFMGANITKVHLTSFNSCHTIPFIINGILLGHHQIPSIEFRGELVSRARNVVRGGTMGVGSVMRVFPDGVREDGLRRLDWSSTIWTPRFGPIVQAPILSPELKVL